MRRVLVVYKKSFLESHAGDRTLLKRLSPADRRRYLRADVENRTSIQDVVDFLERQRVKVSVVDRSTMAASPRFDLVVTVGGDGTFFAASHYVRSTPVLSVNSDPENSLGLFACADRTNFKEPVALAISGRLPATRLNRLSVTINRTAARELVTNDILFAHRNPAAMSHYRFAADGRAERQRSSGVWIATAAGSTAAIRAAGGSRMPIESDRMQFLVREPYGWPASHYALARGTARRAIDLTILMAEAALWIDGSRLRYDVRLGDRVRIATRATPLTVLGYDDARRQKLFP
jgi:NAD+ kinase